MFRVKVALISAIVLAGVTAGAVLYLGMTLDQAITKRVEKQVEHAEASLRRTARLEGIELTTNVASLAREDEFVQIFAKTTEDDRRKAAFIAVEARQARLEQRDRRKAAIVAVIDKAGKVVARDLNINSLYGDDLQARYKALETVLQKGMAIKDVWLFDGQMYRVGAAPVRSAAGEIVGALIVGYVQSVSDAGVDKDTLGVDVAYFLDGKIQSSSFNKGREGSESAEEKALASQLFEGPKLANAALEARQATPPFRVKIGGEEWIGAAAPLPGNATKTRSGFVVLTSLAAARSFVPVLNWVVIGMGLIAVLAAIAAASMTARRFLAPLDKIESGVTEVINGNRDYVFESPSPDFEGLANDLNVMLARLLGRPEPGEEDEEAGDEGGRAQSQARWQGESLFVEETATAAAGGAVAAPTPETAALAAEPADAYYDRIWREWSTARQQTGEGVQAGLTAEQFITRLKTNEAALAKKYGTRMVRFKVQIKNNQTTLKPVPLN